LAMLRPRSFLPAWVSARSPARCCYIGQTREPSLGGGTAAVSIGDRHGRAAVWFGVQAGAQAPKEGSGCVAQSQFFWVCGCGCQSRILSPVVFRCGADVPVAATGDRVGLCSCARRATAMRHRGGNGWKMVAGAVPLALSARARESARVGRAIPCGISPGCIAQFDRTSVCNSNQSDARRLTDV